MNEVLNGVGWGILWTVGLAVFPLILSVISVIISSLHLGEDEAANIGVATLIAGILAYLVATALIFISL